ncbi:MAG: FAD/NAD(P)-binding protein [Candidatus Heimdallarchaeota archaeon]|nr:FAD/NAD(P)-binding protein [Candidatus Heimdallarchaeota archaeon]
MTKTIAKHDDFGDCTPQTAKIVDIRSLTDNTKLFDLQFTDSQLNERFTYKPGQFVLLSVFGVGEVPISITSSPHKKGSFQLGIRMVGNVTTKIHQLKKGDIVGIRGPYGNGFPVEENKGKDLLFVAGGIGYLPLRSAFREAVAKKANFGKIFILYGDRCPTDVLFVEENDEYKQQKEIIFHQTVDRDDDRCWDENIGVVTTLFPFIKDEVDPDNTVAMICGPPIMYKFVVMELEKLKIKPENIYLSLERKMQCGVGKCCHCGIGDKFVCLDGPVFSLEEIQGLLEAL